MPALTPEFTVNQYGEQWQETPDIAVLNNGNFVVVWRSFFADYDTDVDSYYIGARIYSPAGQALTAEGIASLPVGYASYPSVAALTNGGFAVAFEGNNQGLLNQDDIYVQAFNPDGSTRYATRPVNPGADDWHFGAEVIGQHGGGYTVLWSADEPPEPDGTPAASGVFARTYNAACVATTGVVHVNNSHLGEQMNAQAARLTNGNLVVVFDSEYTRPTPSGVGGEEVRMRILGPNGQPIGPERGLAPQSGVNGGFALSDTEIAIAPLSGGRFVVTWYETVLDAFPDGDTGYGIFGRVFGPGGNAAGKTFTVGLYDNIPGDSAIAALNGGGFVVAHSVSKGADYPYDDVFYRLYSDYGVAVGGNVRANVRTGGDQAEPTVAALPGGNFAIAWQSDAADADHEGIAARIFSGLRPGEADLGRGPTEGADRLKGTAGADRIDGRGGDDVITGADGADTVLGGDGNDDIVGGNGADRLFGGAANDILRGNNGLDQIVGGDGRDTLQGGASNDTLTGGAGNDVFDMRKGWGRDVVTKFEDDRDTLRLDDALWGGRDLTRAEVVARYADDRGDDVVLTFGKDQITLEGLRSPKDLVDDLAFV